MKWNGMTFDLFYRTNQDKNGWKVKRWPGSVSQWQPVWIFATIVERGCKAENKNWNIIACITEIYIEIRVMTGKILIRSAWMIKSRFQTGFTMPILEQPLVHPWPFPALTGVLCRRRTKTLIKKSLRRNCFFWKVKKRFPS